MIGGRWKGVLAEQGEVARLQSGVQISRQEMERVSGSAMRR